MRFCPALVCLQLANVLRATLDVGDDVVELNLGAALHGFVL